MSSHSSIEFDTIELAIADMAAGRLVIVTDDEDRENEGDLIMAASKATPETVNMMIRYCSGIVCVPTVDHHLRRLGLGPMVSRNREVQRTDFTVSVDAAEGISTGISAYDRTRTIHILANPDSKADELVQPGHVFPLRARPGGVLERAGHTEAAVDLAVLAGLHPSGVLCELVNDDGTVQRLPQLLEFKKKFGLHLVSIAQLIEYRLRRENLVELVSTRPFASAYGDFTAHVFRGKLDGQHHLVLTKGSLGPEPTLVRVHTGNVLTDVFQGKGGVGSQVLAASLEAISREGRGALLYLQPPAGGEQLIHNLETKSCETAPPMGLRDNGAGAQVLRALGLSKIRLLSNSQRKVVGLDGYGLEIVEQVPV